MADSFEDLKGFEFSSCHIRAWNIIWFTAQQWSDDNDDPLEQRPTAIFMYCPDDPPGDRWGVSYLGEATGVHGAAVFKPNSRSIFVTEDGEVYCAGQGDDDWEKPVSRKKNLYFSNVKSIRSGHAICVGPRRKVYIRNHANNWTQLDRGLFPQGENTKLENTGFSDIDGFSESDMYACGGHADLWHYDGNQWEQIDVPANSVLENICCADDDWVYITTNRREIIKGRGEIWEVIQQDLTDEVFESIVCFNGKVLISTVSEIYEVTNQGLEKETLGVPNMNSKAHLATGDGILVVAGGDEAAIYDGKSWSVILETE
ncbi:hypothetical protein THII_2336 [Thioploca ingrica]|uniref:Uncharacterized protein n=1 Tax=Thioploca ingrica TaxID=40754 RepID=A0A090AF03_9GAMM|nr:hypothetical protein THII_2336 [Thioploca ingrica]